jgi:hypothetical protein
MKEGSGWLRAAGACGAVVAASFILLWGDGSPQIPGGSGTTSGPSIWQLPSGLGLILLVVLLFGTPLTALLAFIGLTFRLGLGAALWIAGLVLVALILIL